MDSMDLDDVMYPIPANVSSAWELIPGFGMKELLNIGISVLVGVLTFLIMLPLFPWYISIPLVIGASFIAYFFFDKSNAFAIAAAVIGIIAVIIGIFKIPWFISSIAIIPFPCVTAYYVKRDPIQGFSMYQYSKFRRDFKNSQKVYYLGREL